MEEKRSEPKEREKRIQDAIESYKERPKVKADPKRVKKETKSLRAKMETKYDKADKIELSKPTGFDVNSLMSDVRYRLGTALYEKGLHRTDYGKGIINDLSLRK